MAYLQHSPDDIKSMLSSIGAKSMEDLFSGIPKDLRCKKPLKIPVWKSEQELLSHMKSLAAKNKVTENVLSFIGGGAYDHSIPSAVGALISRGEFLTSYTPYQPEISQGTLQVAFEYQSMFCALSGMEVSNASVYDGSTAFMEAVLMALRVNKKRKKLVISGGVHPEYLQTVQTYLEDFDVEILTVPLGADGATDLVALKAAAADAAMVGIQSPNFFGTIEDMEEARKIAKSAGAVYLVSADPFSMAILKTPGECGADIVTSEGQSLGNELGGGGPYFGMFACRNDREFLRQLPGRLVGQTVDRNGKRGFVLTMQTREQHIRREKATSNICTSSSLCMLKGVITFAILGPDGMKNSARVCYEKAHYLWKKICGLKGFEAAYSGPFFREFAVKTPGNADDLCKKLQSFGIFGGIPLGRYDEARSNQLLIAVTDKHRVADLDRFVDALARAEK